MTPEEMMNAFVEILKKMDSRFITRKDSDGTCVIEMKHSSGSGFFLFYEIFFMFRERHMEALYHLPFQAPKNARKEVAEYLCRANYRTEYGKFVLDNFFGHLRYDYLVKPASIAADAENVIDECFDLCRTIDFYASGLMAVVVGAKSAAEAFADVTKSDYEPTSEEVEDLFATSKDGESTARRRGKKKSKKAEDDTVKEDTELRNYSLKGLNIQGKISLETIVAAVRKFKSGKKSLNVDTPRLNILLFGVPGSGKTAFVRYLARKVGMPLRTIRVSDVLSRYSGETEQKIAETFREAKEKGEMLFLDEIDSFLQDRKDVLYSWEVTQVNELLQQMEDFGGVMVGATNFADNLDKAVLRRFTYKLKLDYLTDEGKRLFFRRYFKTKLTGEERQRLNAIENLTPGDFRTVREGLFYLSDNQTNDERLEALEAESLAKGSPRAKIGF